MWSAVFTAARQSGARKTEHDPFESTLVGQLDTGVGGGVARVVCGEGSGGRGGRK